MSWLYLYYAGLHCAEMRDLDTIGTTMTAAETGHLIFATLHTNNSAQTVDRIVDVFPAHQQNQIRAQLAFVLEGVITQTLLPKAKGRGRIAAAEIMIDSMAPRAIRSNWSSSDALNSSRVGPWIADVRKK